MCMREHSNQKRINNNCTIVNYWKDRRVSYNLLIFFFQSLTINKCSTIIQHIFNVTELGIFSCRKVIKPQFLPTYTFIKKLISKINKTLELTSLMLDENSMVTCTNRLMPLSLIEIFTLNKLNISFYTFSTEQI